MATGVSRLRSIRWSYGLAGFAAGMVTATCIFLLVFTVSVPSPAPELWISPAHAAARQPDSQANPRDSICYIYGVYSVEKPNSVRRIRTEFSGTGFLVAPGLVASNGHIAEPWRNDGGPQFAARSGSALKGSKPRLESLVAFFPGVASPVVLSTRQVSTDADVALLTFAAQGESAKITPLALEDVAAEPGDEVTVIGYPLGLMGMLAKAPRPVTQRLMREPNDLTVAQELARLALIRPSSTTGHLGDVVDDTLVFDASTAHGGSGGPVLNREGKVIGITSAYLRGFSGGTLGVSVRALRPLLQQK